MEEYLAQLLAEKRTIETQMQRVPVFITSGGSERLSEQQIDLLMRYYGEMEKCGNTINSLIELG